MVKTIDPANPIAIVIQRIERGADRILEGVERLAGQAARVRIKAAQGLHFLGDAPLAAQFAHPDVLAERRFVDGLRRKFTRQ